MRKRLIGSEKLIQRTREIFEKRKWNTTVKDTYIYGGVKGVIPVTAEKNGYRAMIFADKDQAWKDDDIWKSQMAKADKLYKASLEDNQDHRQFYFLSKPLNQDEIKLSWKHPKDFYKY